MRSVIVRSLCAVTIIGLLAFEWGKQFWLPDIPIWKSQGIFILFILVIVVLLILVEIHDYTRVKKQITQEIASRKRLEVELSQRDHEYKELLNEKNLELARLNMELDREIAQHKLAQETALANEERFRNMADNIQEGLTIIEDGKVVYINQSACNIFGRSPEEQRTISNRLEFIVPEGKGRLIRLSENAFLMGDFPDELEYWIVRKDGTRRCIHDRYSFSSTGGIARYFVVTTDITEQVQAYQMLEQAVQERTRELSTVLEVSKNITSMLELEPLLRVILEQIKPVIPYSGAAIFTLNDEHLEALTYQSPGFTEWTFPLHLKLSNAGACQEVIQHRSVLVLEDVKGDTPLARALMETSEGSVRVSFNHAHSWIGIPLVIKDKVIGLLSLTHEKPNFYNQMHTRLGLAIANQVAIAMENARLYEQAHNLATLEERQRIAGELHDSVTQLLYGICLYSSAAGKSVRESNFEFTEQILGEIKENALQALQEMRLLIYELHPPMLEDTGLVTALQICLDSVKVRTGLQTELKAEGVDRLPAPLEKELYRVALEALSNLVKYAKAKQVSIHIWLEDDTVYMEICDNGMGFDLAVAKSSGGLGLQNMERRVKQIGGNLEIVSAPNSGTKVKVEVRTWDNIKTHSEVLSSVEV